LSKNITQHPNPAESNGTRNQKDDDIQRAILMGNGGRDGGSAFAPWIELDFKSDFLKENEFLAFHQAS